MKEKADLYQEYVPRGLRHGLTSECHLGAFGDVTGPGRVCTDSDNNGLWTGLVLTAEYFRDNATTTAGAQDPSTVSSELFSGQSLLHNVTGYKGLCARSACGPTDLECAPGRNQDLDPACKSTPATCCLQWRNATEATGYGDGWVWKSDTSSDEIDGHILGLSTVSELSSSTEESTLARDLIVNLVERIVDGGL